MWVSIVSMTENYPDIWNDLTVPAVIDSQDLIDKICIDCGELELLYADPDILKYMIKNWCYTEGHVWQKLADTLNLNYNPIYNLDVTYEETRTPNLTKQRTPNLVESLVKERSEKDNTDYVSTRVPNTTITETPTDTTTEAVAGFNAATFENARQTTRGGSISTSETGTENEWSTNKNNTNETGSETVTKQGSETETETGSETVDVRRYGNQGVTMTQDMIQKERDVSKFSLYEYITTSFKNRFCLLIY